MTVDSWPQPTRRGPPIGSVQADAVATARRIFGGLLDRDDQIGCAQFRPIDHREHPSNPGGM